VRTYNTILSAQGTIQQLCLCLRCPTQIMRSPRMDHVRCIRHVHRIRVPAHGRRRHMVVRHGRRPGPSPPLGHCRHFRGGGGVLLLLSSFAFVLPTPSRRRPASLLSGWGKTTGPPRPPPAKSFPFGNIVVMPFIGTDDKNHDTVAPPQGSKIFEDVHDGEYYDGLQNKDSEDRITPCSAILRPCQTLGGA
jgi:hypothetical protein